MGPPGESNHRTFISLIQCIKVTDTERKKNTFVSLNQSVYSCSEVIMCQSVHVLVGLPVKAQIQSVLLISSRCDAFQIRK